MRHFGDDKILNKKLKEKKVVHLGNCDRRDTSSHAFLMFQNSQSKLEPSIESLWICWTTCSDNLPSFILLKLTYQTWISTKVATSSNDNTTTSSIVWKTQGSLYRYKTEFITKQSLRIRLINLEGEAVLMVMNIDERKKQDEVPTVDKLAPASEDAWNGQFGVRPAYWRTKT